MDNKLKHLEFIQQAINRMASNLFLLKGWTITLVAALFALAAKDTKDAYFLIAYIPPLVFWGLDGYFLALERQFRALYDEVRFKDEASIDFSMSIGKFRTKQGLRWREAMWSPTLAWYYGGLFVTMVVVTSILK